MRLSATSIFMILFLISCSKEGSSLPIELIPIETKTQLLFPEKNSECTTGRIISLSQSEVTFRWTSIETASTYKISVTNILEASTEIFTTAGNTLDITLMRGTPYTWKVTTILINSNDEVDSDTEAFYNAAATGEFAFVPFPSICIAPENNAQLSLESSSITLEWEASDLDDDILNYDVYFGATTSPLLYAEEVLDTQLQVSELIAGNRYYWQVVTRDAQGNESISEVFTFEVID